jgi:hypothetical protein
MIIWGSSTREIPVGGGECFCPRCSQRQPYTLIESKRYFTLYFIPLFPMYAQGRHVACNSCGGTFSLNVLTLDGPSGQRPSEPAPVFTPQPDSVRHLMEIVCAKTGRSSGETVERLKQLMQHSGFPVPPDQQMNEELQMAVQTNTTIGEFSRQFIGAPENFRQQLVDSAKWIVDDGRPLSLSERQVLNQLAVTLHVAAP